MLSRLSRPKALALCALPLAALLAVALLAPLPYSLAQPGTTADVLGRNKGEPVITISGAPVRNGKGDKGELLMTTIVATGPSAKVGLGEVLDNWFREDRAVMPREAVYPSGDTTEQIEKNNLADMEQSQDAAAEAALGFLGKEDESIDVDLELADVGGPSAGLLFALGVIEKLDGDGSGGSLTGDRVIAGTGTIEPDGKVGPVGGVALKTQAAHRDGATVFLVPEDECAQAKEHQPKGLRLIPVTELEDAVSSLRALDKGGRVPSC